MGKKFYITTAIDYTNGAPHIGHAYEKILADAMARYMRLAGHDVYWSEMVRTNASGETPAFSALSWTFCPC